MIRLENALKMSSKRLEEVLKTFWRRLEVVLKTSKKRLEDVLKTYGKDEYIDLDQDVLKTSSKTSSENVWLRRTYSSWSRRLLKTKTKDVFKTSSSRRMFPGNYPKWFFEPFETKCIHVKKKICEREKLLFFFYSGSVKLFIKRG